MNEFTGKKLGEVLAFCTAGLVLLEKGETALRTVFENEFDDIRLNLENQAQKIHDTALRLQCEAVTIPKSEGTREKLLSMAQMYVGTEWDNPAELMEWLGFFEGAAIIHWKLVQGSGEGLQDEELKVLAMENIQFHENILSLIGEKIREYAKGRTS